MTDEKKEVTVLGGHRAAARAMMAAAVALGAAGGLGRMAATIGRGRAKLTRSALAQIAQGKR